MKKSRLKNNYSLYLNNGKNFSNKDLFLIVKELESLGAGELIINSFDKDGMMDGYDLNLCKKMASLTNLQLHFLENGSLKFSGSLENMCG